MQEMRDKFFIYFPEKFVCKLFANRKKRECSGRKTGRLEIVGRRQFLMPVKTKRDCLF